MIRYDNGNYCSKIKTNPVSGTLFIIRVKICMKLLAILDAAGSFESDFNPYSI